MTPPDDLIDDIFNGMGIHVHFYPDEVPEQQWEISIEGIVKGDGSTARQAAERVILGLQILQRLAAQNDPS